MGKAVKIVCSSIYPGRGIADAACDSIFLTFQKKKYNNRIVDPVLFMMEHRTLCGT